MKGSFQQTVIGGHGCTVYLPPSYGADDSRYPVVYVNGGGQLEEIISLLEREYGQSPPFLLADVEPDDWNSDYTPWPAPGLRKGDKPFGGGAADCLRLLVDEIKPFIDGHFAAKADSGSTALVGYSLAGLMSLYALCHTDVFGRVGSLSGSLWYDGWVDYMRAHPPANRSARVYLSLGRGESGGKNPRLAAVGECTEQAASILADQLGGPGSLTLEWNEGGHFKAIPQRFVKAIKWLMR